MANKHWFTNGVDNIIVHIGDTVPDGFYKGRTTRKLTEKEKEIINEKRKKTCLERYGVENPSQSKEVNDKKIRTSVMHYGTEYPMQSDVMKDKRRKYCLDRYGTEYAFQSEEIKQKIRQTNLERYGVEHVFQSRDLMRDSSSKRVETNIERYGVENPSQLEEVKNKKRDTCLSHYGIDSPSKVQIVRQKKIDKYIEHYGVENPAQSEEVKEKIRKTNLEKYGVEWYLQSSEIKLNYSNDSIPNKRFAELLEKNEIIYEREFSLSHYSYDFKVNNFLIEINPYATHNSLWSPFNKSKGIPEDYHLKKSQAGESHGYHVIHIFDWDDVHKIIHYINRHTLSVTECEIKEVENTETDKFLNKYHFNGTCKGQIIRLGLYSNNNLISIMTFGKSTYKGVQCELFRYCSSHIIDGDFETLFNYFVKVYNPISIIVKCDKSKFTGKSYKNLGFKVLKKSVPECNWYNIKGRVLFKGDIEENILIENGFLPVFDCGQEILIWSKSLLG